MTLFSEDDNPLRTPAASFDMISPEDAFEKVIDIASRSILPVERVSFDVAQGHVVGDDMVGQYPVPAFRASIKDGFAVRSTDGPGLYPIVFECHAGREVHDGVFLGEKQVAYITTGGPVPNGADAVVQIEDTRMTEDVVDGKYSVVEILKQTNPGEDVRDIGSDMRPGEVVLRKGDYIGAAEISMLATVGLTEIPVYRKPMVAILSTGDEVVEPTVKVLPVGKVRDSNRAMLVTAVSEAGARAFDLGIVGDSEEMVETAIKEAIQLGADIIITTGGVSMGNKDYIKPILEKIGTIHFGKICMKPGKPCTFATVCREGNRNVILFGLPGNPVSALTTFHLLVSPCIRRMAGHQEDTLRTRTTARTSFPITMDPSRTEYRRVRVSFEVDSTTSGIGTLVAHDVGGSQISSRIMSYCGANALLEVPSQKQRPSDGGVLDTGTVLPVLLLQNKRIIQNSSS